MVVQPRSVVLRGLRVLEPITGQEMRKLWHAKMTKPYCGKPKIYPEIGDPCWLCYYDGFDASRQKHRHFVVAMLRCLDLVCAGKHEEAAAIVLVELANA